MGTEFDKAFGERLKALREKEGMSREALGQAVDASPSAIGMWERGDRSPSNETVVSLARRFDVSTDYLLTGYRPDASDLGCQTGLSQEALDGFVSACKDAPWFFEFVFTGISHSFEWTDFGAYLRRSVEYTLQTERKHVAVLDPDGNEMFGADWGLLYKSEARRIMDGLIEGCIKEEVEKHAQKKDNP